MFKEWLESLIKNKGTVKVTTPEPTHVPSASEAAAFAKQRREIVAKEEEFRARMLLDGLYQTCAKEIEMASTAGKQYALVLWNLGDQKWSISNTALAMDMLQPLIDKGYKIKIVNTFSHRLIL